MFDETPPPQRGFEQVSLPDPDDFDVNREVTRFSQGNVYDASATNGANSEVSTVPNPAVVESGRTLRVAGRYSSDGGYIEWITLAAGTVLTASTVFAASLVGDWDTTEARGETRQIEFQATEGTWMSVDVSPDGRWIVFDLLGHIYRLPAGGGEAECLTQDSGIALNYHPRISPDGTEIAFISDRRGQDNLWVMKADGSAAEPVALDEFSRMAEPAWTPDGQSILITRRLMTGYGFYRVDDAIWLFPRNGGEPRQLVGRGEGRPPLERFAGNPRYQWASPSPDGRYVYFNSAAFDGDNRQIKRLELSSGVVEDVTETKTIYPSCCGRPAYTDRLGEYAPEVSPDGRWLAFARKLPGSLLKFRNKEYSGRTALWLRDLETGDERILLDPIEVDTAEGHPSWNTRVLPGYGWAEDSRSVVISQGGRIRRVEIADGSVTQIPFTAIVRRVVSEQARGQQSIDTTFTARALRWPVVSPDDSHLVFEAVGRLWEKKLPDGEPHPLTGATDGVERTPSFSPDGRQVVYVWEDPLGNDYVQVVDLATNETTRLTSRAGTFLYPSFLGDGSAVLVGSYPAELSVPPVSGQWQLVRLTAADEGARLLRRLGGFVETQAGSGGRIWFTSMPESGTTALHSMAHDGGDERVHLLFDGPALQFSVSPDGSRVAFVRTRDVYVAPLPDGTGEPPPTLDPLSDDNPLELIRVSEIGGFYPHWRGNHRVAYVIGGTHVTYDLRTRTAHETAIGLEVRRDVAKGTIGLRNARLIALAGGRRDVIARGDIVVEDGRIRCVGTCDTKDLDRVIDLRGKTIMPGWVGTHAHHQSSDLYGMIPQQRADSAIYLAYGITTTFDPAGPNNSFSINEMAAAGKIIGPRSYSSGPILTCDWDRRVFMQGGLLGDADDVKRINSYSDARDHVRRHAALGAISIKDYKQCTRRQRQMLAEAAREFGTSLTTENGDLFYILGQLMNGHTGWEHPLEHVPIYNDVARFIGKIGGHYSADLILSNYPHGNAIEHWFSRRDLWNDEKANRWMDWRPLAARRIFVDKPLSEFAFPILSEGAWDMAQEGAYPTIAAHGEQHGLGNHWEAQIMAMAAPPLEVLRYATYNGAHFLGLEKEVGTLEVGKVADLVVLNSNPLEDIRNSLDNLYVMRDGNLYDAMTLDQIWPETRPYGPRPWYREDIYRRDVRSSRRE